VCEFLYAEDQPFAESDEEGPSEYWAAGAPARLRKYRTEVAYRTGAGECAVAYKFRYVISNPDGTRRIFEALTQAPSNFKLVRDCKASGAYVWDGAPDDLDAAAPVRELEHVVTDLHDCTPQVGGVDLLLHPALVPQALVMLHEIHPATRVFPHDRFLTGDTPRSLLSRGPMATVAGLREGWVCEHVKGTSAQQCAQEAAEEEAQVDEEEAQVGTLHQGLTAGGGTARTRS